MEWVLVEQYVAQKIKNVTFEFHDCWVTNVFATFHIDKCGFGTY